MKAISLNGKIKQYNSLPKSWGNVIGGFNLLSDNDLESYGFYDVVMPESFNPKTHTLGELHFDSNNNVFTYAVNDRTWSETLSELKSNKIEVLRNNTNKKLAETDWYIIRNVERSIEVPQDVQDARTEILSQHNTKESDINALATKKDVATYEFE